MNDASHGDTLEPEYAERLKKLSTVRWKRLLDVQRPYRWNLRRLSLGVTLDIGCGIGRNLANLPPGSVGVDHNQESVQAARARGLAAYTTYEAQQLLPRLPTFDSLLIAHVLEHMDEGDSEALLALYLPALKQRGRVVLITPQERGFATDPTHVRFADFQRLHRLALNFGLTIKRSYSFPFPRFAGTIFPYNEFVVVAQRR